MDFRTIAERKTYGPLPKLDLRPCPDQYVGKIAVIQSNKKITDRQPAEQRPQGEPCVLLVLESPHIREFRHQPAPAMGSTGTSIATRLSNIRGLDDASGFGLVLLNAIQHQCSLGLPTTVARGHVFLEMWQSGGSESFTKRLDTLFRPGDIVVNACTKGGKRKPAEQLRVLVQSAIESTLRGKGAVILRRTHPSSWHSSVNHGHEWPYAA